MTSEEKMKRIKNMIGKKLALSQYYNLLEEMNDIKYDYNDYMITGPIKVEEELKRVDNADYELCTALLTMLLREDRFSEGSFERRLYAGQVDDILERMLKVLG